MATIEIRQGTSIEIADRGVLWKMWGHTDDPAILYFSQAAGYLARPGSRAHAV